MYLLKQQPEDFFVQEISTLSPREAGSHALFWMTKKYLNTEDAIQKITQALQIPRKYVGVAGNKDRTAVTKQLISVHTALKERLGKLKILHLNLKFYGYTHSPLSLGDLLGNQFDLVLRNLNPWEKPRPLKKMVNYFGEQRFSVNNADVGKALVQKQFKQALHLILESKTPLRDPIEQHLKKHRNDSVGALRLLPQKLLKLYVHSYQAKLFNELTDYCLFHKLRIDTLPLIGFATEIHGKTGELVQRKLNDEKIKLRDFIVREIPELSSEGGERTLFAEISDLHLSPLEDDELNLHKKKVRVQFRLPKGSYATEAVRQMMASQ